VASAVIVNDMAELNIDADLLRAPGMKQLDSVGNLVQLENGCICW
jgi:G3E family GTPase